MTSLLTTEDLHNFLVNQRERFFMDMVDLCNELVERIDSETNRINNINKFKFWFHNGVSKESTLKRLYLQRERADNLRNNIMACKDNNAACSNVTFSDIDAFAGETYIGIIRDNIEILLDLYKLSYKELYDVNIDVDIYTRKTKVQYINESDIIETQEIPIGIFRQTVNKDKAGLVYKIEKDPDNYNHLYLILTTLVEEKEPENK